MKTQSILGLFLAAVLLPTANSTLAACSLDSVKGKFAGSYSLPDSSLYWPSDGALMLRFDGTGKINIIRGSEGSDGEYGVGVGSGTYSLGSNCTGKGSVTLKVDGQVVARGKFDFYVGGTKSNQEILGTYQNTTTGQTGSIRLIRSHL